MRTGRPGETGIELLPPLILASLSPYRQALLERLGLPFECRRPDCDEASYKAQIAEPEELAAMLARAKAASVADACPGSVVIGGDQVCVCEGRILSKPGTIEQAIDQLALLAGREHRLLTALAVVAAGRVRMHLDVTRLWMRPLPIEALARYVAADRPLDCAGSYKLEARGITLFQRIESSDHTAVTGMPLLALVEILAELGYPVP